jgi:hypothetical protein
MTSLHLFSGQNAADSSLRAGWEEGQKGRNAMKQGQSLAERLTHIWLMSTLDTGGEVENDAHCAFQLPSSDSERENRLRHQYQVNGGVGYS